MSDRKLKEDAVYAQDDYKYGFHDDIESLIDTGKGLTRILSDRSLIIRMNRNG